MKNKWLKRCFVKYSSKIECFGAAGSNCSTPCKTNYFGYQCKNSCDCQKNEICNKYLGCQMVGELRFEQLYINI